MTVTVPDTIKPGGAFPVAMSNDLDRPSGGNVETSLVASEATSATVAATLSSSDRSLDDVFSWIAPDQNGRKRRFGRFRRSDGALLAGKWGILPGIANGGLSFVTDAAGQLIISLGTVAGKLPIGTGGYVIDTANPNFAMAVTTTDSNGRVRRAGGTTRSGVPIGAVGSIVAGNGNGGLVVGTGSPGVATLSLGTVSGKLPIGTGGYLFDNANPRYTLASTIADVTGRVRKASGVTVDGANDAEVLAARGSKTSLAARLNVSQRPDGLILSEQFGKHCLSETRSKIGDIMAGAGVLSGALPAPYQLVINFMGNSWHDNYDFFIQRIVRRLRNLMGDAGAGFVGVERGCADFAVAAIVKTGSWTVLNAATADGVNVPAPHIIQISSTTPGDKVRLTQKTLQSDSVALFAAGNGAVVAVSKNGGAPVERTLANVSTDLGLALAATDFVDVAVVSGTVTLYGLDLRRNQTGVRINKLGASASTWPRHLAATAATYQAGLTALGGDLCCMIESINGAASWDAAQEVALTASMVGRVRAALPLTDIMLVSPPTTLASPFYSLADRAYALRAYAASDGKMAHLDLQYTFGANVADYSDNGHAYFTSADINHPSVKGRPLVSDALYRMIMN